MIQINPEQYFYNQAKQRRIEPEKPKPVTVFGQANNQAPVQPVQQNQSLLDKWYPLIVLGIIAIFALALVAILKNK